MTDTAVQTPAVAPAARLRLRRLDLHGFKSFADRTTFTFDAPVTAVVGPNGCGKSNVVDAVKWVLGEQSAKSLRGGSMGDVIFNGAQGRPAAASAEVTLSFENPRQPGGDRPLPVDYDEVAVGRVLLRDGTSHYKVNNRNARLRDVRDLFLDTGVGTDAYSVIEQGRVARMLDANAAERRAIFEEAAGVSRFKAQKKEALRKLERTEQNLLRLNDVVEEVGRRLKSVRTAAGKAKTYRDLAARLEELRRLLALREYHVLTTKLHTAERALAEAAERRSSAESAAGGARAELAGLRRELEQVAAEHQAAERDRVTLDGRLQRIRQQAEHLRQQASGVADQRDRLAADAAEIGRQRTVLAETIDADAAASEAATKQAAAANGRVDSLRSEHAESQRAVADAARAADAAKAAVLASTNALATIDRRLGAVEVELRTARDRAAAVDARAASIGRDVESATKERDDFRAKADALAGERDARRAAAESARRRGEEIGGRLSDAAERLAQVREDRGALASRRKLLADLESRREGVAESVRRVLAGRDGAFGFVEGIVADVVRADVEHAAVVEAALSGRDQWLVAAAPPDADALAALAALPGRVTLLAPPAPPPPGRAGDAPRNDAPRDDGPPRASGFRRPGEGPPRLGPGRPRSGTGSARFGKIPSPHAKASSRYAKASSPHAKGSSRYVKASSPYAKGSSRYVKASSPYVEAPSPRGSVTKRVRDGASVNGGVVARAVGRPDAVREHAARRADGAVAAAGAAAVAGYVTSDHARTVARLIGDAVVVDDWDAAVALHDAGFAGRCVTRGGLVRHADGTVEAGRLGEGGTGLVGRRSELDAVARQLEAADAQLERLRDAVAADEGQSKAAARELSAAREAAYAAESRRVEAAEKRAARDDRLASLRREVESLDAERGEWTARAEEAEAERASLSRDREAAERERERQEATAAEATKVHAAAVESAASGAEALSAARVEAGRAQEQQLAARRASERHEGRRRELADAAKRLETAADELDGRESALSRQANDADDEAATLADELESATTRAASLAERVGERRKAAGVAARNVDATQAALDAAEDRRRSADAAATEARVRSEAFLAGRDDDLDVPAMYEAVRAGIDPGTDDAPGDDAEERGTGFQPVSDSAGSPDQMTGWKPVPRAAEDSGAAVVPALRDLQDDAADWPALAAEARDLRGRVAKLGGVDLNAIDELDELEQRHRTLTEQLDDLTAGRKQLLSTIDDLDREGGQRFAATFEAVREHFGTLFRKLFGGGRADLSLQAAEVEDGRVPDPLEAGIEITARPPGKQPAGIAQLSGGEKTMTCVALLLAIFRSRPSPFCLLDEVDAALDEANNARFVAILDEFARDSQFVVITHSKPTMRAADALYGVTMPEPGVSRRVAVRFDEL